MHKSNEGACSQTPNQQKEHNPPWPSQWSACQVPSRQKTIRARPGRLRHASVDNQRFRRSYVTRRQELHAFASVESLRNPESGLAANEVANQGLIPTAGRATTYPGDADGENYVMPMIGPMGAGTSNHEYSPCDVEVCFGSLTGTAKIGLRTSGDTPGSVFIGVTKEVSVLPASKCVTVEIGEDDLISYLNDNRMNAFLLHLEVEGGGSEVVVFSVEATWYDQYNNPR